MKKFLFFGSLFALLILYPTVASCQWTSDYTLEKLGPEINTPNYDEISPCLSTDGQMLYFTRVGYPEFVQTLMEQGKDLSQKFGPEQFQSYLRDVYTQIAGYAVWNPANSQFNQDVWVAHTDGHTSFRRVEHPGHPLNNALPNSISSLTPFSDEVIVINQFLEEGGMKKGFSKMRKFGGNSWSFPEPIEIDEYHNSGSDVNITISSDGQVMILSMERYDSYGKTDLYISFLQPDGSWSKPQNMGKEVNSRAKELTPHLSEDMKALYFSSERYGSLGKNDIYVMYRQDDTWDNWSDVRTMIEPINSKGDDSRPYFNTATGYFYFTSTRDGSSDIFRVKIAPPNPLGVQISGTLTDPKTGEPMKGTVVYGPLHAMTRDRVETDDQGQFTVTVPKGQEYAFMADGPNIDSEVTKIYFNRSHAYFRPKKIEVKGNKLEQGDLIALDPIYFERSKPEVKAISFPALDRLGKYLKTYPSLYIKIVGHTDDQGERESLLQLSESRAQAIKDYLVSFHRIKPVRIETVGLGPDKPVYANDTERNRAKNRRVEVEVTHIATMLTGK